ncbi:hypothetical protein HYC85_008419 [Camellia sinensis]|uniref:Uncharacterized protein n=1 Tax=Camellia sinensis TaxID=4442 RepID=A0A7J7HRR7_CAMSI|nr:hypothetical protein HYC85_008419 [Camellia sinensis]
MISIWNSEWNHIDILLVAIILVIVIKTLVVATVVKGFQYNDKTSLLVGISLAEIEEFAFVLLSHASNVHLVEETSGHLLSECMLRNTQPKPYFSSYVPNPVLVIIDVQREEMGIPTKAYYAVEEVKEVTRKLAALKGLDARLQEIRSYLDLGIDGKLPLNHEILCHLQVQEI